MAKKKEMVKTSIVRGVGDNSGGVVEGKKLLDFISSIEKIETKKAQILQEIREEYASANAIGMDTETIRAIVKERRVEPEKLKERQELLLLYKSAIGMIDD